MNHSGTARKACESSRGKDHAPRIEKASDTDEIAINDCRPWNEFL